MTAQFDQYPSERRRSPRIDATGIKIEYFPEGDKDAVIHSTAKNICAHGICLYMPEFVEVTKTIVMKIFLPGSDAPIAAKGTIIWYSGGGKADCYNVGIEFGDLSPENQQRLSDYINSKQ